MLATTTWDLVVCMSATIPVAGESCVNRGSDDRQNPVLGKGFGKAFDTPIPLADISGAFPQWQFFPHNSMLGLWAFGGVLAIGSWLYLAYAVTREGVRTTLRAVSPDDVVVAVTGTAMSLMVVLYSYLDISFDNQTMLVFGTGLALVTVVKRGLDRDAAAVAEDESDVDLRTPSHVRGERRNVGV